MPATAAARGCRRSGMDARRDVSGSARRWSGSARRWRRASGLPISRATICSRTRRCSREQGQTFSDRGEGVWSDLLRQKSREAPAIRGSRRHRRRSGDAVEPLRLPSGSGVPVDRRDSAGAPGGSSEPAAPRRRKAGSQREPRRARNTERKRAMTAHPEIVSCAGQAGAGSAAARACSASLSLGGCALGVRRRGTHAPAAGAEPAGLRRRTRARGCAPNTTAREPAEPSWPDDRLAAHQMARVPRGGLRRAGRDRAAGGPRADVRRTRRRSRCSRSSWFATGRHAEAIELLEPRARASGRLPSEELRVLLAGLALAARSHGRARRARARDGRRGPDATRTAPAAGLLRRCSAPAPDSAAAPAHRAVARTRRARRD